MDRLEHHGVVLHQVLLDVRCDQRRAGGQEDTLAVTGTRWVATAGFKEVSSYVHDLQGRAQVLLA